MLNKSLIAVVNAHPRKGWRDAIRTTWMPLVPKDKADVIFFLGRGGTRKPEKDEVFLDCDDSYMGLPDKIREITRWAHARDYSHTLKCDDDVVLDPEALLGSGYDNYDYSGRANRPPTGLVPCWVPMGFNYWLSKRSQAYIINADLPEGNNDDEKWVALNLHAAGIDLHGDNRYKLQYGTYKSRPLRPETRRINRPLRINPYTDSIEGTFSWCIFLEGNSGSNISTDIKIDEFHRVFKDQVIAAKTKKHTPEP